MSPPGERGLITDFFLRNFAQLAAFARRQLADTAARDGEDIVQDVALSLLERTDLTAPIVNLAAFIYRSIRNRVVDELRKPAMDLQPLQQEEENDDNLSLIEVIGDDRFNPAEMLENESQLERLYRSIDALPADQRNIVVATEFEGRSFRELSVAWQVPIGTLLARKSRAIQVIRKKLLEKEEYDQS